MTLCCTLTQWSFGPVTLFFLFSLLALGLYVSGKLFLSVFIVAMVTSCDYLREKICHFYRPNYFLICSYFGLNCLFTLTSRHKWSFSNKSRWLKSNRNNLLAFLMLFPTVYIFVLRNKISLNLLVSLPILEWTTFLAAMYSILLAKK